MKVFYAFRIREIHRPYDSEVLRVITSPIFARREDCERFIQQNSVAFYSEIAEVELQ